MVAFFMAKLIILAIFLPLFVAHLSLLKRVEEH